jgi:hypothetical protein
MGLELAMVAVSRPALAVDRMANCQSARPCRVLLDKNRCHSLKCALARGVGVVGNVWQNRNINGHAVDPRQNPFPSQAEWAQLPPAQRMNMTWDLAKRMQRVGVVFAVAVLSDQDQGDVVAVLSADTTANDLAKFDAGVRAFLRRTAWGAWQSRSIGSK